MTCLETRPVYGQISEDTPAWNGGARSNAVFSGDCYFGFEVPRASVGVIAGLNDNDESTHFNEIEHGLWFQRGSVAPIENGIQPWGPGAAIPYNTGDRFYILRLGSQVLYCQRPAATPDADAFFDPAYPAVQLPGNILYTSLIPSYGEVFLDASMYMTSDQIIEEVAGVTWAPQLVDCVPDPTKGQVYASLPFAVKGAYVANFGYGELPFEVVSRSIAEVGINGELPFGVLGADIEINALLTGDLPFTVVGSGSSEDDGGSELYPTVAGISGALLFNVYGSGHEDSDTIAGELPFAVQAVGGVASPTVESGMLLELPFAVLGASSGGSQIPIPNAGLLGSLPFEVLATGTDNVESVIDAGVLQAQLPFEVFGTGTETASPLATILYGEIPIYVDGGSLQVLGNFFQIGLTFNAEADIPSPYDSVEVTDSFISTDTFYSLTGTLQVSYTNKIAESMQIGSVVQTFYNPTVDIVDEAITLATVRGDFVQEVSEQLTVDAPLTFALLVSIAEELYAQGAVATVYQGVVTVLSAILISDQAGESQAIKLSDGLTVQDAQLLAIKRVASVLDSMTASTTLSNVLTIVVEETAALSLTDSVELTSTLLAEIMDEVEVYSLFKTNDEIAQGWVMNTEGSLPISEYDNYSFNSLTYINGEFYGANDSGLYTLDGDDDAGTPITAELSSMMLDFATSRMKRIRSAYLGYTADDELVLKVRSVDQGELSEHWYKARPVDVADAPREGYVRVGQGLRSRYWQFELTNINGADFEIDQLELYPLFLNRRV